MKTIGLRARAACECAVEMSANGLVKSWGASRAWQLRSLEKIGATLVVPPFPLHSSWRPPNKKNRKQSRLIQFVTIVVLRVEVENKNNDVGRSGLRLLLLRTLLGMILFVEGNKEKYQKSLETPSP